MVIKILNHTQYVLYQGRRLAVYNICINLYTNTNLQIIGPFYLVISNICVQINLFGRLTSYIREWNDTIEIPLIIIM